MASYIKKNRIVLLIAGIVLVGLFVHLSSHEKIKDAAETGSINTSRSIKTLHKGNPQLDFDFGKSPVYFIENRGQVDQKAKFYAKTSHYTLWLTREGLVFDTIKGDIDNRKNDRRELDRHPHEQKPASTGTQRDVFEMSFRNADKNPEIIPVEKAKLKVNYFKGNDRAKWVCDVPTSLGVLYKNLYNNIDLKVYGMEKQVEYDWIVRPGGSPEDIRFHLKNIESSSIDEEGNLVIETTLGKVKHTKPAAYQVIKNKKVNIKSRFKRIGNKKNSYGFFIGTYDKSHELVIDPVCLSYSTYLGGSDSDRASDIAVDSSGNYVYVTGYTSSNDFPTLNRYQNSQFWYDVFVTKIDTTQSGSSALLYSSYLGGNDVEYGNDIAVDNSGIAYIAGHTNSTDFPTLNQYQTDQPDYDAFVTKIDTNQSGSASLLYSTYLGGDLSDQGKGIAIDGSGNAYVSGTTHSTDFPTLNQYQTDQAGGDAFVTKLDTTQSGSSCLVYSTYLGGSFTDNGSDLALDSSGYVYVIAETYSSDFPALNQYQGYQAGADVTVSKIDTGRSGSSSLLYSTFLGGSDMDHCGDIAADSSGIAYVTGRTYSTDFPTLNQYQTDQAGGDAFVARIDTTQSGSSSLLYSTYLGGNSAESGTAIACDSSGNAYVTGYTYSADFPTLNQYQTDPGDSTGDAFVTRIDTTQSGSSSLVYSTYLGGDALDAAYGIAVNGYFVYVCGHTDSTDFPTARPYQTDQVNTDAFITKLYESSETLVMISGFSVSYDGGRAVVQWQTSSETGTTGFHLYRKGKDDETYQRVNRSILVGLLTSPQGGVYRAADPGVSFGETCSYKLVEIESRGGRRIYGPFTVTVGKTGIGHIPGKALTSMRSYAKEPRRMTAVKKARIAAMKEERDRIKRSPAKSAKGRVKIAVKQDGLYLLRAGDISAVSGLHPQQVSRMIMQQRLKLTNKGKSVSWFPAPANAGIYFYGQGIDSLFTDTNIYWLEKGEGHLMEVVNGGCPPAAGGQTFIDHLHIEKDRYALTALFDNPHDDYWLWDYIVSGDQAKQFSFFLHGVSPAGNPGLTVNLQGATATPHHVMVKLNGTDIGESRWQGTTPHHFTIPFDRSLLRDGGNSVEVQGILSGDAGYSIFHVDSFDLKYGRYYRAFNNRLFCRGDNHPTVTIEGFAGRNIMVFDVSHAFSPKLVSGTFIDRQNRVSFVPASSESRYLIVDESGINLPHSIIADSPSRLKENNPSVDYFVIVPEGFEEAAGEFIDLRRLSGLEGMAVCLEDIYDQFNHGLANPRAIKEFLSYAYDRWNGNNLKYVVLAGEGTFDYKDNLGYGENLIPPIMAGTPRGLFAADNRYGDVKGDDGIPDIAVGRLPVATEEEFRSYIKKLSDYEDAGGGWTNRIIMAADNRDQGGDFPSDSDRLSRSISGYDVEKIYLPHFPDINEAKKKLLQSINQGATLFNYLGHAGLDRFTREGLLEMEDVNNIQNENRLPVLTAMTCVSGRFSLPGYDSLSEALILKKNGGVIAVWGPTGASSNHLACNLAEDFFNNIFQSDKKILGRAVLQAIRNFTDKGGPLFMVNIYNLLGDPTLEIK